MENLWAPWRMEYIKQPKDKDAGCFICEAIAATPEHDEENLIIHRGTHCVVMMNRYPYNNGHMMIAPTRHEAEFGALSQTELAELTALAQKCEAALKSIMTPQGFNMGLNLGAAAGAGLDSHIHFHIVPRWAGDTNFMPVLADVRVVPQALSEAANALREKFKENK